MKQRFALLQVPYDLLIGADGAGSVVRSALEQVMPTDFVRRYRHKQMYSMAQVTPSNPEDIPQHAVLQGHIMANRVRTQLTGQLAFLAGSELKLTSLSYCAPYVFSFLCSAV